MTQTQKQFNALYSAFKQRGKGRTFGNWLIDDWNNGLFSGKFDQGLYNIYNNMYNANEQNNPIVAAAQSVSPTPNTAQQPQEAATSMPTQPQATLESQLNDIIGRTNNLETEAENQYRARTQDVNNSNNNWQMLMKRLMDKEDRLGSGNPFIDMLDGYINYRKQKNPDYKWGGLVGGVESGIKGLLGLFNKNKQQPQAAPFIRPSQAAPFIGPLTEEQERIFGRR